MANMLRTIKQALEVKEARLRQGTSHTKTRGEVSGGGKKPWKQKGTGRARAGSNRSPLWRGGGIIFGPRKNKNPKKRINRKVLQLAYREVMAGLKKNGKISDFGKEVKEFKKTHQLADWLREKGLLGKRVFFVINEEPGSLTMVAGNLPGVEVISWNNVSLPHLLVADHVFIAPDETVASTKKVKQTTK